MGNIDSTGAKRRDGQPCRLCRETEKTWEGDDRRCAFPDGTFSTHNWNCATANGLRSLCNNGWEEVAGGVNGWTFRDDDEAGSFGCFHIGRGADVSGYVVMSWYKQRGKTAHIWIMDDDRQPRPLTLQEAEDILEHMPEVE